MVSKFQWKPFWLATQRDPQNDWTATQNGVNYDVFAQAPFLPLAGFVFEQHISTIFMQKLPELESVLLFIKNVLNGICCERLGLVFR